MKLRGEVHETIGVMGPFWIASIEEAYAQGWRLHGAGTPSVFGNVSEHNTRASAKRWCITRLRALGADDLLMAGKAVRS